MKSLFKIIISFLVVILLVGAITGGYLLSEFYLKKPAGQAEMIIFEVEKGASVKQISEKLNQEGVIDNQFIFELYVWLMGLEGVFQPGEYTFKKGQSTASLVKEMTTVNTKEKTFTIIEGWNLRDLAEYLINKKIIKNEQELYKLTGTPARDYRDEKVDFKPFPNYEFLSDKPNYVSLEGYIYPDTYRILEGAGVEKLLQKALSNFDKKLKPELREEIERQGKTIFEIVTVASILEREVKTYEDKRIVADLIYRRIKYNMPLQMDSTINYITDSGRDRSTYSDLKIDSPWNSYKNKGLPLGPINNPSILSITAAIYPKPNEYFYFLTDKEGNIYYAKTGAEHKANRKYLE